ncbi:hypothetical protein [Paraclostridium bifermentans]|uniref:hypothetical protein n=1 Tax=Paraclostridium bifermentans TaxID=1490 RepID=UPI00359C98DF
MKINKKIALGIITGVMTISIGIFGVVQYGKINILQNTEVTISSGVYNLKNEMKEINDILIENKGDIEKYNGTKSVVNDILENGEKIILLDNKDLKGNETLHPENCKDINKQTEIISKFNESVDKLIDIYNKNDEMKSDKNIYEDMETIIATNNSNDDYIDGLNDVDIKLFNEGIEKFPANMVKGNNGWEKVNNIGNK